MFTVLVADKFEKKGLAGLEAAGCRVDYQPELKGDALRDALATGAASALIVRSTQVTSDILTRTTNLGLVVRAGAGVNTIDVEAASRRGIMVCNCPGKNAVAVAELTMSLILALDRRLVENVVDLRNGSWNKKEYSTARGLKGRTLGILGMGMIGQEVARRAAAFDLRVIAWSRSMNASKAAEWGVQRRETPSQVASDCDILSLHLAVSPDTSNLVNADVLAHLAPESCVINTSRAEVLDYAALAEIMVKRNLRVGLDVFPDEPASGHAKYLPAILKAGGIVYGTHHIGASTDQAQDAIADETVRIVRQYMTTGWGPNCVNIETRTPAKGQLVVRHYDKVGVLAAVLDTLRRAEINVEEMSNTVFQSAKAAVAVLRLSRVPGDDVIHTLAAMSDMIIHVEAKSI